ncbi:unnamed protein product [Mytilus coruscus]|uniref:Uncharacterized protein n=1 Tax=Mytilus coruscus TaxID=42192 RepID=A0A6J8C9F4_MYTCO|nr:unnamed protein product [Mytilus coruscus]
MKESNSNNGFNNEGDYADTSSDDYESLRVQIEQVSTINGTNSSVGYVDGNRQGPHAPIQRKTSAVIENTEPVIARDILIRFQKHKWFILAFICGVVLTLAIVVPGLSYEDELHHHLHCSPYNFTLKFNRTSTHSSVYLSTDNTILSNFYTTETSDAVNHPEQLQSYRGALGNRCFTSTDKIYFEIKYTFNILYNMPVDKPGLVAEVGLVSRNEADNYYYVGGSDGWSFSIHNCRSSICISAQYKKQLINEEIKIVSHDNTARTHVTGRLGFFVSMKRQEFSIIDKETMKILHTFQGVSSTEDICPAFAVYNPNIVEVILEISYSYDFKNLPVFNVIA